MIIISILASLGFVLSVTAFIAGFRMIKLKEQRAEASLHRVNGYLTIILYVALAAATIINGTGLLYIFAWIIGLAVHLFKLLLVRKGLAVRYGGYLGAMLILTWIVVIFTHLPTYIF